MTQNYRTTFYPKHIILRICYLCTYRPTIIYDRQSNGMCGTIWECLSSLIRITGPSSLYLDLANLLFQASRMAILSEFVDEAPQDVGTLLNSLRVPSDFARHEILEDKDTIARLGEWKASAFNALKDLRGVLENKRHEIQIPDLIYTCAAFQGDGDWTSEDMCALSYGKLVVYAITVK